ncbi:hypothetical protein Goarm_021388, partial [Gossypium armourianum]|nr:hypothetical protein [Gossypium armourianum]
WDKVENKTTVILYGGGAIVFVWLSFIFVGAINSVPLLPKIMELVGLGYFGWFVFRYILFKVRFKSKYIWSHESYLWNNPSSLWESHFI